jgi:hypothetical protein
MHHLSAKPKSLKFRLYCLDRWSSKRAAGLKNVEQVTFLGRLEGSIGHAQALNKAVSSFDQQAVNILADTDAIIVLENWDDVLRVALYTKGASVFGTQHEGIGGYISGDVPYQQYKEKPSTTWIAFRHDVDTSGLDLMPAKADSLEIRTKQDSVMYNLPIGYRLFKDTGWQLPTFLEAKNLSFLVMKLVKPSSGASRVLKGTSDYHDEFHWGNDPFLVHQRGSMRHLYRTDPLSKLFFERIDAFLSYPDWSLQLSNLRKLQMKYRIGLRLIRKVASRIARGVSR